MNNFTDIGRIGKDAVTRFTQGGESVTGFSLAVDSGWGDKKQTNWFDCSLWGKRGEKVAEYLTKGKQVMVQGEFGTREHEGKTYLTLRVSEVKLIDGKPQDKPQRQERASAPAAPRDEFEDQEIPF